MATSEEAYYSDKNTYSTDTTALNFNTSTGNVLNILTGTNTGWSASITNARVSSITGCKIGSGTDTTGIGVDGVVVCN